MPRWTSKMRKGSAGVRGNPYLDYPNSPILIVLPNPYLVMDTFVNSARLGKTTMLWTIFVILLVIAIVVLLIRLIQGRNPV